MNDTITRIAVHPIDCDHSDEGCTEGLSLEECDEVCTPYNKRHGICQCKRFAAE